MPPVDEPAASRVTKISKRPARTFLLHQPTEFNVQREQLGRKLGLDVQEAVIDALDLHDPPHALNLSFTPAVTVIDRIIGIQTSKFQPLLNKCRSVCQRGMPT